MSRGGALCVAVVVGVSILEVSALTIVPKPQFQSTNATRLTLDTGYGTFRLNFHRFDRLELALRGNTQP